jgi:hypothetical protein
VKLIETKSISFGSGASSPEVPACRNVQGYPAPQDVGLTRMHRAGEESVTPAR